MQEKADYFMLLILGILALLGGLVISGLEIAELFLLDKEVDSDWVNNWEAFGGFVMLIFGVLCTVHGADTRREYFILKQADIDWYEKSTVSISRKGPLP